MVENDDARVAYTGAGTTGPFTVPFMFLADGDLTVYKVLIADGTQTLLVLTTDYTLTGAEDEEGGELTLVVALSSSYQLVIINDPDITQLVDYPPFDNFPAEVHERALDRLTIICQRLSDMLGRAFRLADGDISGASGILPAPVDGGYWRWNSDSTAVEFVSAVVDAGSFIEGGAGAIERTVTARLCERISAIGYSTLQEAVTYAASSGKALVFPSGTYSLPTAITAMFAAHQHWIAMGQVNIVWTGAADAQMFNLTTAGFNFRMEGPFVIDGDDTARECMRIVDVAVGTGNITMSGPRFENAYNAAHANGAAGLIILGGFGQINLDDVVVRDVSRAAGVGIPGTSGSLGIGVIESGAFHCPRVELNRCQVIGVTSEEADGDPNNVDCDGFFHAGPSGASFGNEQPSTVTIVRGGRFEDNRGRHIKTQSGWCDVSGVDFIRDTYKSIADGTDVDVQYGMGDIHDNCFFYNNIAAVTPFGASFAAVTGSVSVDTAVAGALTVRDNTVINNHPLATSDMPYFVSLAVGAAAVFRSVTVKNNKIMGSGRVTSLLRAAGAGGFAGAQVVVSDNYLARLSSHLINFAMDVSAARVFTGGNVSTEGTLRSLVHTDVAGGLPIMGGPGNNVGFTKGYVGALSGLTEGFEVSRLQAHGDPNLRDTMLEVFECLPCANGATVTFSIRGYVPGRAFYTLVSTGGRVQNAEFAHDGTALSWNPAGANGITVGDGADPAVAGDINVWMDTTAIKARNDTGGDVVLALKSIG